MQRLLSATTQLAIVNLLQHIIDTLSLYKEARRAANATLPRSRLSGALARLDAGADVATLGAGNLICPGDVLALRK